MAKRQWPSTHLSVDFPGFVYHFNIVTVRIKNPGCIIVLMVLELYRRRGLISSARCNCSAVERVHYRLAVGHKCHMNGSWIRLTLLQPKNETSVFPEAFQVGMTILALIVSEFGNL